MHRSIRVVRYRLQTVVVAKFTRIAQAGVLEVSLNAVTIDPLSQPAGLTLIIEVQCWIGGIGRTAVAKWALLRIGTVVDF